MNSVKVKTKVKTNDNNVYFNYNIIDSFIYRFIYKTYKLVNYDIRKY